MPRKMKARQGPAQTRRSCSFRLPNAELWSIIQNRKEIVDKWEFGTQVGLMTRLSPWESWHGISRD